jgi:hypothetical protein
VLRFQTFFYKACQRSIVFRNQNSHKFALIRTFSIFSQETVRDKGYSDNQSFRLPEMGAWTEKGAISVLPKRNLRGHSRASQCLRIVWILVKIMGW